MSEAQPLVRRVEEPPQALLRVSDVKDRMLAIKELMQSVMKPADLANGIDGDFGVIPGTGNKPTLLKSGAEKLGMLFRLAPTLQIQINALPHLPPGHREYIVTVTLTHAPTGTVQAQAAGSCSTAESKYRYRKAERVCPTCETAAIIKGKAEYGGGWLCFNKKGGCGEKFPDGDPRIESQETGRVENPDIADSYNTALKIAVKRAQVAAMLIATGGSAMFTQDMDDDDEKPASTPPPKQNGAAKPSTPPKQQAAPAPAAAPMQQYFDDRITGITEKNSPPGAAKKWKLYAIMTAGGTELVTFSDTIKAKAEVAMAEEQVVTIRWTNKGRGPNIDDITTIADNQPDSGVYPGELVTN